MTALRVFVDGPWGYRIEPCHSSVPTRRIPVYADPPEGAVCADEQVTVLLGHYIREDDVHLSPYFTHWHYHWKEAR